MITINQSRKAERSFYGEAVRLSNEFRNHAEIIKTNIYENNYTIPAKTDGFDIETATVQQIASYRGESQAQKDFLKILIKMKQGNIPEDIELLGETGYSKRYRKNLRDKDLV